MASSTDGDLHASFRPRSARAVALALGALTVAGGLALVIGLPRTANSGFGVGDQVATLTLAAGICWFLYRQGAVAAHPHHRGLVVRNLISTREVEWAQIVAVNFGSGDPWVHLDLSDGDTLAVMAVQRADGERGQHEARRLATLVALHEPRER
ncbi:PH domain-containing protein [Georgenia halophila]|uniref:PH domain-containing protein n=1 Tax=Georgenia halophila TaxID=620889 RepID=A0ABP8LAE2_9MICO